MLTCAAVLACTAMTYAAFRELRHDDAYITFQYARHLGSGEGLVFNPGERILGATSPLFALLLALVYALFGDVLPRAAVLVGALSVSAQALLVYRLVERRSRSMAAILALLIAAGFSSSHSWMALETNLFAALVLATFWALDRGRVVPCGIFLGLSFLCRYDAALLVPIVFGLAWRENRRLPVRLAVVSLAVVMPWLAAATVYYGSFLPNTFFAKQGITPAGTYLAHYLGLFAEEPWRSLGFDRPGAWLSRSTWVLWGAGLLYLARYLCHLLGLVVFSVALLLAYAWIGAPSIHHWHMYLPGLTFAILAAVGALGWLPILPRLGSSLALGAGTAAILAVLASEYSFARTLNDRYWFGRRHGAYSAVASWLGQHAAPDGAFLAPEVGTLGYLTRLRMIDPCGLINETNDYPQTLSLRSMMGIAEKFRPDIILVDTPEQGLEVEASSRYRIVKVFAWGVPWSTLLVRRPEALRSPAEFERLRAELPPAVVKPTGPR